LSRGSAGRTLAGALLLGVALGVFSFVGDLTTGDSPEILLNALANAFGPWVVIAFVAGIVAARPTAGAWAGPLALMVAVVAYYVVFLLAWGDRLADVRITIVVWLAAALVAGVIFGTAGGAWAAEARWRPLATALLCGGLLAEAAYQAVELAWCDCLDATRPTLYVVIVDTLFAVAAPLVLVERGRRLLTYAMAVALAIAGYAAIVLVLAVVRGSFSVLGS
jgi:hypothetical protein